MSAFFHRAKAVTPTLNTALCYCTQFPAKQKDGEIIKDLARDWNLKQNVELDFATFRKISVEWKLFQCGVKGFAGQKDTACPISIDGLREAKS